MSCQESIKGFDVVKEGRTTCYIIMMSPRLPSFQASHPLWALGASINVLVVALDGRRRGWLGQARP